MRTLVEQDFEEAAEELGCSVAAIKAVDLVESRGGGFNKNGSVVILFEGHIFWRELVKLGWNPNEYRKGNEDILYRRWTRQYYGRGKNFEARQLKEHDRLKRACRIKSSAALKSASYGRYQILGQNYSICGFSDVYNFYFAMDRSEKEHLRAFIQYVKKNRLDDELREHRWADFARVYNGPSYHVNQYDVKLEKAFKKFDR